MRRLFTGCIPSIAKITISLLHLYVNPVNHNLNTAFSKRNIVNGRIKEDYVLPVLFIALKKRNERKSEM